MVENKKLMCCKHDECYWHDSKSKDNCSLSDENSMEKYNPSNVEKCPSYRVYFFKKEN